MAANFCFTGRTQDTSGRRTRSPAHARAAHTRDHKARGPRDPTRIEEHTFLDMLYALRKAFRLVHGQGDEIRINSERDWDQSRSQRMGLCTHARPTHHAPRLVILLPHHTEPSPQAVQQACQEDHETNDKTMRITSSTFTKHWIDARHGYKETAKRGGQWHLGDAVDYTLSPARTATNLGVHIEGAHHIQVMSAACSDLRGMVGLVLVEHFLIFFFWFAVRRADLMQDLRRPANLSFPDTRRYRMALTCSCWAMALDEPGEKTWGFQRRHDTRRMELCTRLILPL